MPRARTVLVSETAWRFPKERRASSSASAKPVRFVNCSVRLWALSSRIEARFHVLPRGLSGSPGEVHRKSDRGCHRFGDAFGCLSHVFGLLAVLAGSGAALFVLRPPCLFDLGVV